MQFLGDKTSLLIEVGALIVVSLKSSKSASGAIISYGFCQLSFCRFI